jgi:hypothetical protein
MEVGSTTAGNTFSTVNLSQSYTSPVVIPFYYENANSESISVRLDNISSSSFDIKLQSPSGATLSSDTVHYIVIEEGAHTMPDGTLIEAHTLSTNQVGRKSNWNGVSQTYTNTYTADPLVLHAVQTNNDTSWIASYISRDGSRTNTPNTSGFEIAMNGSEAVSSHGTETLGWIAIETGQGTIGTTSFESEITTDSITGHSNGCSTVNFTNSYSSSPLAIASQLKMDGNDGGWAVGCSLSSSTFGMHNEEDQVGDSERSHTAEIFGYMAFSEAFAYDATSTTDITLQVRSCNDAACSGESFTGPDGTGGTSFTTETGESPNVSANKYFQYRATLTSNSASTSPQLSSVTIDYTIPATTGGGGGGSGDYATSGTFTSQVLDSDSTSTAWIALFWNETLAANTDLTIAVRSGNSSPPSGAWSTEYTLPNGVDISAQTGRYLQYRASFSTADNSATSILEDITVTYR